MPQGKIKFFNETKGFGFIVPSNGDKDIFFHSSGLLDKVSKLNSVTYDLQEGKKGLQAINVRLS